MYKYDVSVIVVIFNPVWEKVLITLNSILNQKNINFEIVICDDGSVNNPLNEIEKYIVNRGFKNYKLISHAQNVGTVRNYFDGLQRCEGEFCYGISPGDMLYDEETISDFYKFAKANNSVICFGNPVFYSPEPEPHILEGIVNQPQNPKLFEAKSNYKQLIEFCLNSSINGASYFRITDIIKKLLSEELDFLKYVEDTPSSLLALAEGYTIDYYDRNIVIYEYGTGISTRKSRKWDDIVRNEILATYDYLKCKFPQNPVIDVVWYSAHNGKWRRRLYKCLKHPFIMLVALKNRRIRRCTSSTDVDKKRLVKLIK